MQRSRSASSSSVRCGCQYFQSTDPLPERRSLVGTPPLSRTPTMGDHEYEPINPKEPPPPPVLNVSELESEPRPATPRKLFERRYIKIPNENAVIIPLHGDSDEEINPDRYENKELTVHEVQRKAEDYYPEERADVRERTPEITITVSQPDSPGPESLPLEKTSRGMRTRLRSQAGEFREKLRKISAPKISLPERPKMKFPDRPKIHFPDRPKIHFPDRPQFLKEKPKFLSEKPKFLTEKPKFLSEKPKFLTEKPKFLTEKPKFLSEKPKFLTDRPKFNFPDRPKFKMPERFSFDRHTKKPSGPKQKRPNPSSLRRPLRDTVTVTSSDSSKHLFHNFRFKTYPRFLTRKKRERERAQQLAGTSLDTESSPSTPPNRRKVHSEKWVETFRDIKFADDEASMEPKLDTQDEEGYEENTEPFHDSYITGALRLGEEPVKAKMDSSSDVMDSDKEQQSSGSESMRRRAGVLEEIDSDEFFLRQKGLSREDMDVSRYLSKEIRDAFRSPKNALAHMDSTDYDDEGPPVNMRFDEIPKPPERKKSVKSVHSEKEIVDSGFNTFPLRPNRRKQSEPDFGSKEFEEIRKPPRKYRSKSDTRQRSTPSLARSRSQGIEAQNGTPLPAKRRKSSKSLSKSVQESTGDMRMEDVHREIDAHEQYREPIVPFRKSRSRGTSLADEDRTSRGADSTDLPHDDRYFHDEPVQIADDGVVTAVPVDVVPLASAPTEDSFGYAVVMKEKKAKPVPPRPPPPPTRHRNQFQQLQSQLHTIKNQGVNFFFTYPRRAIKSLHKTPVRPTRNYSTLGPSRPPRRTRVFREPVYVDGDEPGDLEGVENKEDKHEDVRDLQSGEVVERIQGRPLPPPPRPPRKTKEDENMLQCISDQTDTLKENQENVTDPEELTVESYLKSKQEDFLLNSLGKFIPLSTFEEKDKPLETINTSQQTSFEVAEVSVSIQTDPLPDGFIVDDIQSEFDGTSQKSATSKTSEQRQTPISRQTFRESSIERELIPQIERVLPLQTENLPTRRDLSSEIEQKSCKYREESTPSLQERGFPSLELHNLPTFPVSFPDKLHLTELDVDKLNVHELQASKLQVLDIESTTLQVTELNSKGGNLVVNGIELPPDFLKNLAAQFPVPPAPQPQPLHTESPQPVPQIRRVLTPPPPIIVQHSPSLYEVAQPQPSQASTTDQLPKPKTTKSKGRKSPTRVIDDSEDELASVMPEREKRERLATLKKDKESEKEKPTTPSLPQIQTSLSEPSALTLIRQLLSIWLRNICEGTGSFIEGINSMFPEGDKRRDAQTAAVILVVLVAGLILVGFGVDNSVHHHHWDYLPPR
ncbi:uncharacterized protein LOC106661696 isoform X3 [Cimex lectularius]|uniref:Titin n=1 Tax=Cimex lectularius TaxID=79782 RepID=A0A8I6TL48_CIMLE|nr:uncharacterized protein LOC106661696 isoform X3 [Cimex lectularius]